MIKIGLKKMLCLLIITAFATVSSAQIVPTGTYTFENDTVDNFGNVSNGWSIAGIGTYTWLLNSGPTGSPGTGPTVDHTLGTAAGTYIYVEATGTHVPGVTNAILTSPLFDLSGLTNPAMTFWYHMFGAGMGTLYIDVDDGAGWVLAVDSIQGQQQTADIAPWNRKTVNLSLFSSSSIQVRLRKVYGTAFTGDASVDDISFGEMPPYDAEAVTVIASQNYAIIPQNQFLNKQFEYEVRNVGADTINGVVATTDEPTTPFNSTSIGVQLLPGEVDTVPLTSTFNNNAIGVYDFETVVSINENDTIPTNDTLEYSFEISDTVYARERGNYIGGIGFTGVSGYFGQTFEITTQDTLTSMSVQLESPTAGDSLQFLIFDFTGGTPGAVLDSSDFFIIPTATPNSYSITFPCDVILTPGEYFFAVNQIDTNNLGFAYSSEYYTPNKLFFSTDLVTWTPFESAGFEVTLGLRLNFGNPTGGAFTFDLGPDTSVCPTAQVGLQLDATQLQATYQWSTGATSPTINVNTAGTYTVTVSKCGLSSSDTITVNSLPIPDVNLGNDTAYCESNGFNYTINLTGTPTATYNWTGGVTGPSFTFTGPGFYQVIGDLNGCEARDTIAITEVEGLDPIDLGADTAYCSGTNFSTVLDASNIANASYSWSTGASTPTITVNGPGVISVEVSQTGVCNESITDTITITEQQAPVVSLNDTGYCEGSSVILRVAPGYDQYTWSTGETTDSITVLTTGTYTVTVSTSAGCEAIVSSDVSAYQNPVVDLGPDITTDVVPITLDAGSGFAAYLWSTGATTQTITTDTSGTYSVEVTSAEGCTGTDDVTVDVNVGIATVRGENLSIYPNPVTDRLFIDFSGAQQTVKLACYSLTGALVKQEQVNIGAGVTSEFTVDELPSGMYILQLTIGAEQVQHRFTVK